MNGKKRQKLKEAGWTVGSAEEFLELTPEEAAYIEIKLNLARHLRAALSRSFQAIKGSKNGKR